METQEACNGSILRFVGRSFSASCGYCKSTKRAKVKIDKETISSGMENSDDVYGQSINFGVMAHLISLDIFNRLLDIGWSRSGSYLYKPIMEETCCPQYTIRLDVHKFRISRTQKRVLRMMHDFLKYGKRPTKTMDEECRSYRPKTEELAFEKTRTTGLGGEIYSTKNTSKIKASSTNETINLKENSKCSKNHDQKKKVRRRKRAEERLKNKGIDIIEYKRRRILKEQSRRRTLDSFFDNYVEGEWKHQLEVRTISVLSDDFKESFEESFSVYKKYQETIHEDNELNSNTFDRFLGSSPFSVPSDNVAFSDSKELPIKMEATNSALKLGAYHQQYLLDGRIIAVGVIDVLPQCMSSKYFYYDPDYKFLSLGTYSALREISFTKQLSIDRPELHFYYMGFYVYDCPKMRYKGKFRPSDLLCDKTFKWFPLSDCDRMLAANDGKFTIFSNGEKAAGHVSIGEEEMESNSILADSVNCVCSGQPMVISPSLKVIKFGELRKRFFVPDSMRQDICMLTKYMGLIIGDVNLLYT